MTKPVLIIHGGAGFGQLAAQKHSLYEDSLLSIVESAHAILKKGAPALDAVSTAIRLLEDDPLYNAGKGSKIQSDGHIRMSASIMDGTRRRFGACINVERLKNPIDLARRLMSQKDRTLAGEGAMRRARQWSLKNASPFTPAQIKEFKRKKAGRTGTVGALALDRRGHLAAGTSTGGRGFEFPHRVSDSPTVAGNFANRFCAVSATGVGEEIVELGAAASVCALVEAGWSLERAVKHVLKEARKDHGGFGLIALDRAGHIQARTNTRYLLWAATDGRKIYVMQRERKA